MLGHNVVPHHHHDVEHHSEHHHSDNHHDHDSEDEESDFGHPFSSLQHSDNGITFLNSHNFSNTLSKQLFSLIALLPQSVTFQNITVLVRQHSPPYKFVYRSSQYLFPTGLRAPPTFLV